MCVVFSLPQHQTHAESYLTFFIVFSTPFYYFIFSLQDNPFSFKTCFVYANLKRKIHFAPPLNFMRVENIPPSFWMLFSSIIASIATFPDFSPFNILLEKYFIVSGVFLSPFFGEAYQQFHRRFSRLRQIPFSPLSGAALNGSFPASRNLLKWEKCLVAGGGRAASFFLLCHSNFWATKFVPLLNSAVSLPLLQSNIYTGQF